MTQVEKVEAERSSADLASLDKIIGSSKVNALVAAASSSTLASKSRAGSPSVGSNSGKTLDPKASVFTPGGRPNMPNSTASSPVLPSGHGATSRSGPNSRKDKSGLAGNSGNNGSASRASTPGVASLKGNSASGARTRAGNDAAGKKTGGAAARARSPLTGNTPKEPGAPRTGGRRQATNVPSQLGKSSINMEDGEISSNASEGVADSQQSQQTTGKGGSNNKSGKSGGGENGGGNKRHRQDPEDEETVKRRRVEEGKQDGVTGV